MKKITVMIVICVCVCVCSILDWVHRKIFSEVGKIRSQLQKALREENSRKNIQLIQKICGLFKELKDLSGAKHSED